VPTVRRHVARYASQERDWRYYVMRDMPRPADVKPPKLWEPEDIEPEEWERARKAVLSEWVEKHPGTRPTTWWEYDAPEDRRRVGGVGMPYWVARPGYAESWFRGMPDHWWTKCSAAFLKCTNFPDSAIPGAIPYDENDPPRYEAEGVYLERLGLLLPGEQVIDREPEVCGLEPWLEFSRKLRGDS
jgi:hypothetical protein